MRAAIHCGLLISLLAVDPSDPLSADEATANRGTRLAASLASRGGQAQKSLKIVVIGGEDAVNIIQLNTAVDPVVEVRDENDLPVAGVLLRFRIRGNRAVFRGGLQELSATTDAAGRAAVTGVQPVGSGSFQIEVTASYQGQTASSTISQTNFQTGADAARAERSGQPGQPTSATGGAGGAAGSSTGVASGGGGLSKLAILGLAGAGAAAAGGAVLYATRNEAPAVSGVTPSVAATLLGTDTAVTFSAQATDPNGDTLSYAWEFGDGATSTEQSPSHIYTAAGAFTVRLTVSDGKKSATSETTVTVRTLTGTWRSNSVNTNLGPAELVFTLNQSGSSVSGVLNGLTFATANFPNCPVQGTIARTAPQVVLQQPPCAGVVNGAPSSFGAGTFLLNPNADVSALTGTIGTQSVTLTRQ